MFAAFLNEYGYHIITAGQIIKRLKGSLYIYDLVRIFNTFSYNILCIFQIKEIKPESITQRKQNIQTLTRVT